MTLFHEVHPAVVSPDLGLPPSPDTAEEGLKALDEMLRMSPSAKVVVPTGNSDHQNALRAVQLGAFDYHLKPIDLEQFRVVLRRAAHLQGLQQESEAWVREQDRAIRFEEILGNTPAMREIFTMIQRVARSEATVLIEGESGS